MKLFNHNLIIIIIAVFLLIYGLMVVLKVIRIDVILYQLILNYLGDFQNVLFEIHFLGILSGNEMNDLFELYF